MVKPRNRQVVTRYCNRVAMSMIPTTKCSSLSNPVVNAPSESLNVFAGARSIVSVGISPWKYVIRAKCSVSRVKLSIPATIWLRVTELAKIPIAVNAEPAANRYIPPPINCAGSRSRRFAVSAGKSQTAKHGNPKAERHTRIK